MSYSDPKYFDAAMRGQSELASDIRYVSHSRLKRLLDVVVSLALILMLLPLMTFVALGLWITSGRRNILARRPVIGRKGTEFNVFSFNAKASSTYGRLLLESELAALPQLFSVLMGHMSLVGPKPLQIGDFDRLKNSVSLYMSVRPGLTGLWFVSDERTLGAVAVTRLDRVYIKTGTFLMDLGILLRTPFVFLRLA